MNRKIINLLIEYESLRICDLARMTGESWEAIRSEIVASEIRGEFLLCEKSKKVSIAFRRSKDNEARESIKGILSRYWMGLLTIEVANELGCHLHTARRYLQEMEEKNFVYQDNKLWFNAQGEAHCLERIKRS